MAAPPTIVSRTTDSGGDGRTPENYRPPSSGQARYTGPQEKFVAQNERDSVKNGKKVLGNRDETTFFHWHFDTVTIMRLSFLALFIALPAAAHATVCPQQSSLEFKVECAQFGQS